MTVTAAQVKELRQRTNVAMLACKKALEEANGDMDQAIEILRKRGASKAAQKGDRSTGEGVVAISGRAMIKLLCETDFVARNENFVSFAQEIAEKANADGAEAAKSHFEAVRTDKMQEIGENILLEDITLIEGGDTVGSYVHSNRKVGSIVALNGGTEDQARDVAMHAVAMDPLVANPEDVPADLLDKEKEIVKEQLEKEGKPAEIMDKIIAGKMKKFCAERALSSQDFVKNPEQTIAEYLGSATLSGFIRFQV